MPLFQTDNLKVDVADGVASLWLDVPGRTHNVLGRQVLADLEQAAERMANEPSLRALVIRSNKTAGFVAGADLHELAAIRSAEEASALSALGQRVFQKVADLHIPSIVILKGATLGGGLELALACDYRLVLDQPSAHLALPEVQLGLLPGWGGTQRLPRHIGLERALQVILAGRQVKVREALDWGLVDAVTRIETELDEELRRWLERAIRQGKRQPAKLPLRTWRQRLVEATPVGRWLVFRGTERLLRERIADDMPAPWEALQAVRVGLTRGFQAGLAFEQEASGRLARTKTCRNLVSLFFLREQVRKLPDELLTPTVPKIRKVGVVGAGLMGAGVAQLAALKDYDVVVQEVNEHTLAAGMKRVEALLDQAVERRLLSPSEARQRLESIGATTLWHGFGDVDLVVEAVVEEMAAKQTVFRELEKRTKPTCILATNTSSLSVDQLQAGLQHPERVAGLHFFNPVHRMPLVEVVRTALTETPNVTALVQFAIALGKTPVVVRDSPGFIVNRVLIPYMNEAVLILAEQAQRAEGSQPPVQRIDRVMRRFGMPIGPLELLDQIGLDIATRTEQSLRPAFSERFVPNPVFARMAERGWLGHKSDIGFYRYHGRKKQVNEGLAEVLTWDKPRGEGGELQGGRDGGTERPRDRETVSPLVPPSLPLSVPPSRSAAASDEEIRDRMALLMVNEAAACFGEGLTEDAATIDLAMIFGSNWAPHRGGPLRYADDRGLAEIVRTLGDLAKRLGPRFEPCVELKRRAEKNEPFYGA